MPSLVDVAPGIALTGHLGAWLAASRTLVVADVHVGYARAARRRGGWLPDVERGADAAGRLLAAVRELAAARVVVAGDLRHSTRDVDDAELAEVADLVGRVRAECPVTVVPGNHDRGGAGTYAAAGADVAAEPLDLGDALVVHEPPAAAPERWTLCGHLHPAVELRDETGAGARYPCALVGPRVVVLPAFGRWAGGLAGSRLRRLLFDAPWAAHAMAGREVWPPLRA